MIILRPKLSELDYSQLTWLQIHQVILLQEGINDDGDEEIEEDLSHNDLVQNHEACCSEEVATAFPDTVIGKDLFHCLALLALEKDCVLSTQIEHQCVPALSSGASEQGQEGCPKVLEVNMPAE